ncbi:MAG: hypothetical protein WBZ37_16790 [Mycobacterium sp.]
MLAFLRSPIGRWVALTVVLPLIAALLSYVGRALQRRSGHPTRISKFLMATSRIANRRKGDTQEDPALAGQAAPTEPPAGERPTGTVG